MKKVSYVLGWTLLLAVAVLDLSGCGSPPVVKTAKKQISAAEEAIESGNSLARYKKHELAVVEYEKALGEIRSAEGFAIGNEAARLTVLKEEARSKKVASEFKAKEVAGEANAKARQATTSSAPVATVDQDAVKRKAEAVKDAEMAASKKEALEAIGKTPKAAKKVDEPEDAGDVAANAKTKAPAKDGDPAEPAAAPKKEPLKDKNGIFANIDENTPPLVIAKLQRIGKFVFAYCQIYNKSNDGKRITVYNFFKDRDNQLVVPQLTTASFPYDRFSAKVKDLIGDQSVRNLAPNSEEINGGEYLQFVSVGECDNEAKAQSVVKLYLDVRFSDGTRAEFTSAPTGAATMPEMKINIPKK
ncbi:MAG: hypothetical protein WCT04_01290 [Planctomycetota bacterium]